MTNQRIYYSKEAELQAKREQVIATLVFLALGLGIGAVLALFFAPRSGAEIRQGLASTLEDRLETSREATMKALHKLEGDFNELRQKVEQSISDRR